MGFKNVLAAASLLAILGYSNTTNVFSQDSAKMKPGAEIGKIINKGVDGFKFGLYFSNSKMQIGYVVEHYLKSKPNSLGIGIDLLKFGAELNYFPTNMQIIKPYIGSEVKYENESYFVGKENESYKKNGVGLELKCGTEIKPFVERKIRLFFDLGYNIEFDKKSKGYPENPDVKRDKFIAAVGLKF